MINGVSADPAGWFETEWATLLAAVRQAYSVGSHRLGWALGARLAKLFLVRGHHDDWRAVCELMLAGARRSVSGGGHGVTLHGLDDLPLLQHRLDEALVGLERTLTACGAGPDRHPAEAGLGTGRRAAWADSTRLDDALPRLEDTLAHLRELGQRRAQAAATSRLGTAHRLQRCYEKAVYCFQQVLDALDVLARPLPAPALVPAGTAGGTRLVALQGLPRPRW